MLNHSLTSRDRFCSIIKQKIVKRSQNHESATGKGCKRFSIPAVTFPDRWKSVSWPAILASPVFQLSRRPEHSSRDIRFNFHFPISVSRSNFLTGHLGVSRYSRNWKYLTCHDFCPDNENEGWTSSRVVFKRVTYKEYIKINQRRNKHFQCNK